MPACLVAAVLAAFGMAITRVDAAEMQPSEHANVMGVARYVLQIPPAEYLAYSGRFGDKFPQGLPPSYGSGLRFQDYGKDASLNFLAVTDRGPNTDAPLIKAGEKVLASKVFLTPDFAPRVGFINVQRTGSAKLVSSIALKQNGKAISGRPTGPGSSGFSGEIPLGDDLKPLRFDSLGLDPEGIDFDKAGNLWISDEYGPFIAKVNSQSGEVTQRYSPGMGLPEILAQRQPNRGFEGIAVTPGGKVVAIMQSTLDINNETKGTAQFLRIVTLDPKSGATQMFAYPHDGPVYKKKGNAKIGDLVAIDETHFLLIEQGKARNKQLRNVVYLVDISAAQDLTGLTLANGKALEYGYANDLALVKNSDAIATNVSAGLRMARKIPLFDLRELGWKPEKSEGLAIVGKAGKLAEANELAVISDNDFGVKARMNGVEDDPEAYFVDKEGVLLDSKVRLTDVKFQIGPGSEPATQLWIIQLRKPLKDFFAVN
ncbi:esterase-like activity of phytase family protein [Chitinimonas sp. BJB300]|uniref:esterase-like activity of phytase family protein n=1 Tax=Chitinimonas sp. BJB300 TaxID=1559339 RepID=UPI000C10CB32|nr:esterase-like activity of phytase family protein [Chitinimonas sp. BJB300]PHV11179.1 hypothetical protein CSQ89_12295 [Chitinimonas sp. BJB300]TSJ87419.1 esterase-like activity of phytase family protein [Chitinimonas sp. BJB300]